MDSADRCAEAIVGYCRQMAQGKQVPPDVIAAVIRHEYEPLLTELDRILGKWSENMHPRLRELVQRVKGR